MPIINTNSKRAAQKLEKFDWSKVDAMTDKEIAHQIADNPDAAPDMADILKRK